MEGATTAPMPGKGRRTLVVVVGVIFALLGVFMAAVMIDLAGTPTCEEAVAGECFDGSEGNKTATMVLGWAAAVAALATLAFAIYYAARGTGTQRVVWAGIAALVLGVITAVV